MENECHHGGIEIERGGIRDTLDAASSPAMQYTIETEINQPRQKVIELFDNSDNLAFWQPGFISFTHESGEPGQPGAVSRIRYDRGNGKEFDMIETVTVEGSTYQTNEHKFEAGTPRIAEAIGWSAALDWMNTFDLDAEHARLIEIAAWVAQELRSMGITVYGRHGEHDAAVVSFLHPTINSEDMAHLLDARGYAVRTGHHCAQPLLTRLGISGTVRASFYVYNTRKEAEGFVQEMKEITEKFA